MPVGLLGAIARFACTDPMRPNLNGVFVDKTEVVACDGHRLVRVDISTDPFEGSDWLSTDIRSSYLIPLAVARAVVSAAKDVRVKRVRLSCMSRDLRIELRRDDGVLVLAVETRTQAPDYPPIDQIMISTQSGSPPSIMFDPRLLEDMAPVMDACDARGLKIVGWGDELSPMQFAAKGIRFVVMPMRAA